MEKDIGHINFILGLQGRLGITSLASVKSFTHLDMKRNKN